MKRPNIVIVGHVCIDHNSSEHAEYTNWGSGVLYTAKYLQDYLEVQPTIITEYGPDLLSYSSSFQLHPVNPPYDSTLIFENTTTASGRVQRCLNIAQSRPLPLTRADKAFLKKADILILATLLPNYTPEYVHDLLSYVSEDCLKLLCPQGYFRTADSAGHVSLRKFVEAEALLPLFDVAIFSDEDYPDAVEIASQWKRHTDAAIIVTQGAQGASIVHASSSENIPTDPVPDDKIIDSVGCGDVFDAAFIYYLYKTNDLIAAVKEGHKAARDKLLSTNATMH